MKIMKINVWEYRSDIRGLWSWVVCIMKVGVLNIWGIEEVGDKG